MGSSPTFGTITERGSVRSAPTGGGNTASSRSEYALPLLPIMVYLGLFIAAFLAATLLPMQSEAALAGLLIAGYTPWLLVVTASVGNVLGSTVNWVLGRELARFSGRKWFPVSPLALSRAQRWYGRYGRWSLLLSWMPIIGDPLTLAAGVMREPLRIFLPLVAIAKTGRYVLLTAVTLNYL